MDIRTASMVDVFNEFLKGIDCLNAAKLRQPVLVLIYSTIDAAGFLDRPEGTPEVKKEHFVSWADTYLVSSSDLGCTALELYGARCGMVHSFSAHSGLSKKGKVRTIGYAYGAASQGDLKSVFQMTGRTDIAPVQVESLIARLRNGLDTWLRDLDKDEARLKRVLLHSEQHFMQIPLLPGK